MKKFYAAYLCASLSVTSCLGFFPVFAQNEVIPEEVSTASENPMPSEDSKEEVVRKLTLSKNNLSFGTLVKGESAEPQSFSIKNEGNQTIFLKWTQADSSQTFQVNFLTDISNALAPGDSIDVQVFLQNADTGDHTATLVFEDCDDPSSHESITLSVKVKEKEKKEETEEKEEGKPKEKAEKKEEGKPEEKAEKKESEKKEEKDASPKSQKESFTIETSVKPKNGGYTSGSGTFQKGEKTVLTAYHHDNFSFVGWYLGDEIVSDKTSYTVKNILANARYVARFARKNFSIKVSSNGEDYGSVTKSKTVKVGEKVTLKATPKEGYELEGWYEHGELISRKKKYTIPYVKEDRDLKAYFKTRQVHVTASVYPKESGRIIGGGNYDYKSDVSLRAVPAKGYVFKGFSINKETICVNNRYTLKEVTRDVSVSAVFEKEKAKTYQVRAGVANKGGFISPSGIVNIGKHGSLTYVIAPDNGYAIQEVSVDGKKVGPTSVYTFKDIKSDHTISVAFAPKKGNEKKVKKDKIITVKEARKISSGKLNPAEYQADGRVSEVVTPEMYARMKREGILAEALKIPEQDLIGMNHGDKLPDEVSDYNYDEASGLYQDLDITPTLAKEMIEEGKDEELLEKAYEAGYLDVIVNNACIEKNDETLSEQSIKNLQEFISGSLSKEEKLEMLEGRHIAITIGMTKADGFDEADIAAMKKTGVSIGQMFYVTVMKQKDGELSQLMTELEKPVVFSVDVPKDSKANCLVRVHDGKASILQDIDDNPKTITVKTDKFSPYAFGQEKAFRSIYIVVLVLGALAGLGFCLLRKKD